MVRPPTLREVAAQAGVSKAAASAVLAGRERQARIGAATAERVRAAAAALGWRANATARTLSSGRTDLIGVAADAPLSNRSLAAIVAGMERAMRDRGQHLLLITDPDPQRAVGRGRDALAERRIDALILVNLDPGAVGDEAIVHAGALPHPVLPSAAVDSHPGMLAAARHLARLGHQRIRWFGPRERWGDIAAERLAGLRAGPLPVEEVVIPASEPPVEELAGHIEAQAALIAHHLTGATAFCCFHDLTALGCLRALRAAGRSVPGDTAVVGYDDLYACFGDPPLATVSHRLGEIGAAAVELALRRRDGAPAETVRLPAQWIARVSAG